MDYHTIRIHTAGVFLRLDGRFLFTLGPNPHQGCTPIVRIGGHREGAETGWQCAAREAAEETTLQVAPLPPPLTWLHRAGELEEMVWPPDPQTGAVPLLVIPGRQKDEPVLSLMYLASTAGQPQPAGEVKGLLLPTVGEIHRLCGQPVTLAAYLAGGGQAILNHAFDASLALKPFIQFQLLSKMLLQGLLPG
ncbi:MAG TPA: NUDIX hydrolase [Anaerolineaceae bacterium]|nr:NUDIX hydrolase [Anaerolineaceae bacterium]HPN53400.1 NUDIX hydrolase [Anaerolineaceae bacterium]